MAIQFLTKIAAGLARALRWAWDVFLALKSNTWDKWGKTTRIIFVLGVALALMAAIVWGLLAYQSRLKETIRQQEVNANLQNGLEKDRGLAENVNQAKANRSAAQESVNQGLENINAIERDAPRNVSIQEADRNRCRAFPNRPECRK